MKLRRLSIISFILIAVMLLAGCASSATTFPEESEYSPEALALGTVNRFAGVVIASGETKIEKDESRNIASIAVSAGDSVIAGQVLFTYDGSQAQNNYDKAAIELQQMQITLESYTAQKSQLEAEKAAASQEEQLAYTVQIQELDTTIRETSYNITLKQKEVDALKAGLGELEVKAPSDGKIQSVNSEGGTDANGNPLPFMVLVRTKAYRVKAQISEENISDLSIGDPVLIRSRVTDQTWKGTVASIEFDNPVQSQSGSYDGMSMETASASKYPVYVDLESSDGLMLGQHVFIEKESPSDSGNPEALPTPSEGETETESEETK